MRGLNCHAEKFGSSRLFGSFGAMPKEHKKMYDDADRKQNTIQAQERLHAKAQRDAMSSKNTFN